MKTTNGERPNQCSASETLRAKHPEVYAWLGKQPCISWEFVTIPIESLAELMHAPEIPRPPMPTMNKPESKEIPVKTK